MSPIPTTKFKLNRSQKRLYKELRIRKRNILQKYKFSPTNPGQSPVPELYQFYKEYAKTKPDILYYQLVKLYRRNFYHLNMGNICIGFVSGILTGEISSAAISLYKTADHPIVLLVYFLLLIIFVIIAACYFDFAAHFTLPLFMPNALNEKEMEIIGELLNIKQYFSIHNLEAPGILKVQRPLRKATHIKKFKGVVKKQTISTCRFAKKCI